MNPTWADILRGILDRPYTCERCLKLIPEDQLHVVPVAGERRLYCECITDADTRTEHREAFPWCGQPGHDIWDHPLGLCENRQITGWFIAQEGSQVQRDDSWLAMVAIPEGVTAREVLAAGLCTAPCMLAVGEDGDVGTDRCRCRCNGEWHGTLVDAEVHAWFTQGPGRPRPVGS